MAIRMFKTQAEVVATAAVPVEDAPWYKGILKADLLTLSQGDKVWFKLNTEKPLRMGNTYWVFHYSSNTLHHIAEGIGDELLDGVNVTKHTYAIADANQQKILRRAAGKLIRKVITNPSWVQNNKSAKDVNFKGLRKLVAPRY